MYDELMNELNSFYKFELFKSPDYVGGYHAKVWIDSNIIKEQTGSISQLVVWLVNL